MAKSHSPSIKDDELYDALRDDGMSKEKAARISNAKAAGDKPSEKGGKAPPYEEWTKDQLYEKAQEIGIDGRSGMNKAELITALRDH
ncbi:Rho termination factor N-terminal domain-containing protein [Roseibium limicola]|uniref:Rho termination factor N-terminal domain-containing protein n=1 Tax=Roseibium limicola TaxID=2816037 RepID=A0A939J8X8_9HYPH|nr:Rho termination factor N-terminal domain-containing protein [Roseibium limicola]MBO0345324.1 Rho termination factor N-terminal domain-containing protein [Roseibium limicola]